MKVELHSHTHYSKQRKVFYDGTESPEAMVRQAKKIGLGAMVVTDHNTQFGIKEAQEAGKKHGILVIPGEEINSSHGHVTAIGINETIRPGLGIFDTVDLIHSQGGIAVSVHPFDIKRDGMREYSKACDVVEAFNAMNMDRISNHKALDFAHKNKMPVVAGSDAHTLNMLGRSTINTRADSEESIIKAVRKGRTSINCAYHPIGVITEYSLKRLRLSYDHTLDYIESNYTNPKKLISRKLLAFSRTNSSTADRLFKLLAYTALATTVTYSFLLNAKE